MPQLHAQPYDISASGFYFDDAEGFADKASALRNDYGDPVEEFEIQFIDGDTIDCELARAVGLNQANFADFLQCCEAWEDWQKTLVILAVGECGYTFDPDKDPAGYDLDIYYAHSLTELAEQFVEDGLFGSVPDNIRPYFDYDALARDLSVEYSEATIGGLRLVWRAG